MRKRLLVALLAACLIAGLVVDAQGPPRGPQREIVQIGPDLYRARNSNYFSIFLVTPDGIVLADPINTAFATWMKEQFATRFKVPVKYVIYSHSHWDHIEGGAVFADTAMFVAHEGVARNMDGRIPQMPGDMLDRNNNGRFELKRALALNPELIEERLQTRPKHYMKAGMLASQFAALQAPHEAHRIDIRQPLEKVVAEVVNIIKRDE